MRYVCKVCGYVYDEDAIGESFDSLPEDWACPLCGVPKEEFEVEEQRCANERELYGLQL